MKRFFICAAAAIVALASCSKTEVVNTSAPEEIGFKAVTGVMTKAGVQTTNEFDQTIGVLAYNTTDLTEYFENAEFEKRTVNVTTTDPATGDESTVAVTTWNGATPQYWPIDSSLDFFVYSPYQATGVTPTNTAELKTLAVAIADNSTAQNDYLYSDTYITGKDKTSGNIPVDFDHALAYVTVNFSGDDVITLTDAKLNGTYQSGTYTVTYGNTTSVAWSSQSTSTDLDLDAGKLNSDYTTSWLVVPEDNNIAANTITFNYTIDGMTGNAISKSIALSETWAAGTHYTYNVTIGAKEIKFTVQSVEGWTTGSVSSDTTIE